MKMYLRIPMTNSEERMAHYDHELYLSYGSDGISLECRECMASIDYISKNQFKRE